MGKKLGLVLILIMVVCLTLAMAAPAGTDSEVTLVAGQYMDAGKVTITDDGANITVTYETSGGWMLDGTHLAVEADFADIPQTGKGNPKVGKFECSGEGINDTTMEYVIPIPGGATSVCIAAHAWFSGR